MKAFLTFVCLSMAFVLINGQNIDECLKQDSISCIQRNLYRKAKEFFNKDNIELVGGVSLVKNANRNGRSDKEVMYDQEIEAANDVTDRQSALENFVSEETNNFLAGRSLRINFVPAIEKIGHTARAMIESVPQEINDAANEIVEGRGKKLKLIKVIPLLLAAKAKLGLLATLAFFGIALLAKKAILVSLISLAVSGFLGLRNMWANGGNVTPYNAGGWSAPNPSGWAPPASNGGGWAPPANNGGGWSSGSPGWDDGSYTNQNAQFTGYH